MLAGGRVEDALQRGRTHPGFPRASSPLKRSMTNPHPLPMRPDRIIGDLFTVQPAFIRVVNRDSSLVEYSHGCSWN